MKEKRSLKENGISLKPKQIENLNNLRFRIENEYHVKLSLSEILIDAIDVFLIYTYNEGFLQSYMGMKETEL